MLKLYLDHFETLQLEDWSKLFGAKATLRPVDEQTIAIMREGEVMVYLTCRFSDCNFTKQDELGLTAKQQAVFELLVEGLSNREIGSRLGLHTKTVSKHVSTILDKMGLERRREVIGWYLGNGSINGSDPTVDAL